MRTGTPRKEERGLPIIRSKRSVMCRAGHVQDRKATVLYTIIRSSRPFVNGRRLICQGNAPCTLAAASRQRLTDCGAPALLRLLRRLTRRFRIGYNLRRQWNCRRRA